MEPTMTKVFTAMPTACRGLDIRPFSPYGKVYYARIDGDNQTLYKIGVTSQRKTSDRYRNDKRITMLAEWHHQDMVAARHHEATIISQNTEYRYRGKSPIKSIGNTEMFVIDVLGHNNVANR